MSTTVTREVEAFVQRNVKVRLAMLDVGVTEMADIVGISRQRLQKRWRSPVRDIDVAYLADVFGVDEKALTSSSPCTIGRIPVVDGWQDELKDKMPG